MTRLIYSGLFDELPNLKIVSHHMGGMIPYFSGKIKLGFRQIFFGDAGAQSVRRGRRAEEPPVDYYKMLYADTALGEVAPTRCGHAFFGTDKCVFATDAPFDSEQGRGLMRNTIAAVNALEISQAEKDAIFSGNARGCSSCRRRQKRHPHENENIKVKLRDGAMGAYVAYPDKTPVGAIIAIMEIWGVNDTMRHHAHEFAEAGFVCLVPDLFWRQEPGVELSDQNPDHVQEGVRSLLRVRLRPRRARHGGHLALPAETFRSATARSARSATASAASSAT